MWCSTPDMAAIAPMQYHCNIEICFRNPEHPQEDIHDEDWSGLYDQGSFETHLVNWYGQAKHSTGLPKSCS